MLKDELKKQLIEKAEKIYGKIYPCVNKESLDECFTEVNDNALILWFNTGDNSTHMIASDEIAVYDVVTLERIRRQNKKKFFGEE